MKITTDYYGHENKDDRVSADVHRIYVTDHTGAVWCLYPSDGGLRVSPVAPLGRETIFAKPVASNVLVLQARESEDAP